MKLEILQENLVDSLKSVQKVIPSKPQLPILSSILITAQKNKISLAATDLYVGMQTDVQGKIEKPGQVAVPGKLFYRSISSLKPGKLKIELEEDSLKISSTSNETSIQCLPPTEFPEFPQIEGEKVELKTEILQEIDEKVSFSASIDQTRPVLTALLFEFNQAGLLVVGTDGFRLATLNLKPDASLEIPDGESISYLIPAKAVSEAASLGQQEVEEKISFTVSDELKQALFEIGKTKLFVRLIEGEYPPFGKIVPDGFSLIVELEGEAFADQLKRAQVFAKEASNIVHLIFEDGQLKVVAKSPSFGQQEGELDYKAIKGDDQEREIAFNTKYLLDFINSLKPEKIKFFMNESLTPAMIRPDGDENYQHIVMPFRVNQ